MSKALIAIAVLIMSVAALTEASAQGTNRIGMMVEAPTMIGFNWELSERIAIRPDFSLVSSKTTPDDPSAQVSSTRSYNGTFGVSGVFYIRRWDTLRLYLSPRVSHLVLRNGLTATQTSGSGSLGGQYDASGRFGIFAEAGMNFTRAHTEGGASTSRSIGNRGVIGAIIFF